MNVVAPGLVRLAAGRAAGRTTPSSRPAIARAHRAAALGRTPPTWPARTSSSRPTRRRSSPAPCSTSTAGTCSYERRDASSRSPARAARSAPRSSRQFAGEPDTDVVLSDVSEPSLDATVDGLPDERRRGRDGARRRRATSTQVEAVVAPGGRALRPARRADQQRRRALAERPHPQPRDRGLGARVPRQRPRRRQRHPGRGAGHARRSSRARSCSPRRSSGLTAWSHAAPYCATKAAVIQLAKVAAVEYARDGIRVNCVCPGTFRSAIHDDLPAGGDRRDRGQAPARARRGRRPRGRVLVPRERRVPLDDRVGDRRRRRLRRAVGSTVDARVDACRT